MDNQAVLLQKRLRRAKRLLDGRMQPENVLNRKERNSEKAESIVTDGYAGGQTVGCYGVESIDYDRIAEATSQRPVVVYVDKKAAAVLLSRDMDTAIGNRNIRQLVSMGG